MDNFYKKLPDSVFLFAWNHKKEIFKKEKKLINKNKWFAHIKLQMKIIFTGGNGRFGKIFQTNTKLQNIKFPTKSEFNILSIKSI